jgi:hypothetical protein
MAFVLLFFLFSVSLINSCRIAQTPEEEEHGGISGGIEEEDKTAEVLSEEPSGEEEKGKEIQEALKIESLAFNNGGMIPLKYTCDGENINPPLVITGIPENTKSLVLIVEDPDAPVGTWIHWTVWNISPATNEIPENSVPQGAVEGITDFGAPGYGGPCPPSGKHRYFFKLYSLDITLDLATSASVEDIEEAMQGHIIESAEMVGLYERG